MVDAPDFPVYDADNHLYETEDALTRHLDPESLVVLDRVREAAQLRHELFGRVRALDVSCLVLGHGCTWLR